MAYTVPQMPSFCNVWTFPGVLIGAPRITNLRCQLRAAGRSSTGQDTGSPGWTFLWALVVAAGTDIRDSHNASGADTIEVPAGSGRIYELQYVDDVALGFLNSYRIAFLKKKGQWPTPNP